MQNQFHNIFNNRICIALLIFSLVGLVSFSYISSFVYAPTGSNWQKMQNNSILDANQTTSLASTANDNNTTSLTNNSTS
jgi:hypothetical protein